MRFILGCAALTALITGACVWWTHYGIPLEAAPSGSMSDGLQYVRIFDLDPKERTVTIEHIMYYEGDEARLTAKNDLKNCGTTLTKCAPTLAKGYYVRESGAPNATFPIMNDARVVLLKNKSATLDQLSTYAKNSTQAPVFTVSITSGRVTEIKELNHL